MAITDYYTASDSRIIMEIGERLRALRLRKNITQSELAERALIAIGTVKSLEQGKGKLSSLVAVLRELDSLQQLDQFIPTESISPLQLADAKVKYSTSHTRVRASANKQKP